MLIKEKALVLLILVDKEPETASYPEFTENKGTFQSSLPVHDMDLIKYAKLYFII